MSYAQTQGPGYVAAHRRAARAYQRRQQAAGRCVVCGHLRRRYRDLCDRHAAVYRNRQRDRLGCTQVHARYPVRKTHPPRR